MLKQCQICGESSGKNHVHAAGCIVCGKSQIWCRCANKKKRFSSDVRAFTKEGEEVFLKSIVTICPIEFASEARQMAAEFLHATGSPEAEVEKMLNVELRPIGGKTVTHVMCERFAYTDEVRNQVAWMRDSVKPWAANRLHGLTDNVDRMKSMMVTIDSNEGSGVLELLGLEEATWQQ